MGNPLPLNLAQECRKAEKIITEFVDPAHGGLDRIIPMSVLRRAQGFAIFTVARLGFLMSARAGSGVVVARLADDSWSPPSALGLGGLGAGFNAGLDVTDFLIVLNSKQAVRTFMATGSLQVGGNLSVAVGPLGRAAEASGALNSSGNIAAMFSYSKSKGLYGGVSLEGTVLVDRSDANSKAYHRNVTAKQILEGQVDMPLFATPLISLIEKHTLTGEVGSGVDGYSRRESSWGSQHGSYDSSENLDTLDHELRRARISDKSPSPRDSFSSSYENESSRMSRAGDDYHDNYRSNSNVRSRDSSKYAFSSGVGSTGRYSTHNAKKPSIGSRSSSGDIISRTTDYKTDEIDYDYDSRLYSSGRFRIPSGKDSPADAAGDTFARAGVQYRPRKSPSNQLTATGASDYINATSGSRGSRTISSFPTQFQHSDSSTDSLQNNAAGARSAFSRTASTAEARDPFQDLIDLSDARQSKHNDQAERAPRPSRGRSSGLDALDRELQARTSLSTDESHDEFLGNGERLGMSGGATSLSSRSPLSGRRSNGNATPAASKGWRADYGLPAEDYAPPPSSRPPMHTRTSSAQKLWNRMRGNSNTSKMTPSASFADVWEGRQKAREWERMDGDGDDDTDRERFRSSVYSRANGSGSTSPSQDRRAMRSTSPSMKDVRGTPPPAAIVAAALRRSNNSTPRAGGPMALATNTFRNDPNDDWPGYGNAVTGAEMPSAQDDIDDQYNSATDSVELQVVALFEFVGQEQDDLSFKRGDVIDILRKTESREDWWLGRCRGQIGKCV